MSKKAIVRQIKQLPKYDDSKLLLVGEKKEKAEGFPVKNPTLQEHLKPITEVGESEAVSVVSANMYQLEQHEDAFKWVLDKLPEDIKGKVSNHRTKAAMRLFPEGKDIGLWVLNSVDTTTKIRVYFVQRKEFGSIHIPPHVAGYSRIHRGEWAEEFKDFTETINNVRSTWETIVNGLSKREATDEDIEAFVGKKNESGEYEKEPLVGRKAAKELKDWMAQRRLDEDVRGKEWKPTVWDLILQSIKLVANRLHSSKRVASPVTREESLRKLSSTLLAYALKD